MNSILSYSDSKNTLMELATLADKVAKPMDAQSISVVINDRGLAEEAKMYFDKVLSINVKITHIDPLIHAQVLAKVASMVQAKVILVDGTRKGILVSSALAELLNAPCVTNVVDVEYSQDSLILTRSAYGGLARARIMPLSNVVVASIRPGAIGIGALIKNGIVEEVNVDAPGAKTKLLGVSQRTGPVNLSSADVVVVVGRGVKDRGDLGMVEELAKLLNGAVSCTMPLSTERGWFQSWVGISGVSIRPRLYVGIGVSGQVQHIAGMRDSKVVVAINIDPKAPIFEHADYGIVGDLYKIVPILIQRLRALKGQGA